MQAYINDRFMPLADAYLHVGDLTMQRGYGIFDYFRAVDGKPLFMQDHLDRFYASAESMHLPLRKSREELQQILLELIAKTPGAEIGIRMMLTGGYAPDAFSIAEPNLVITCKPAPNATAAEFEKGLSIMTHAYQRELSHVKSINYLMALWLQPLQKQKGANDILYYNNESITEFPRANVFVVTQENVLATPAKNMLRGITRKHLLQLAAQSMKVEERDITINELKAAKEVFLTATTRRLMPVLSIDGVAVGNGLPGTITKALYQQFLAYEKGVLS